MTGLGKIAQDDEMIESTVAQRRNLDSERMRFETQEQRVAREVSALTIQLKKQNVVGFECSSDQSVLGVASVCIFCQRSICS